MTIRRWTAAAALAVLSGCTAGGPSTTPPPPSSLPAPNQETGFTRIVAGASDTVGSVPGSSQSMYVYRFRQTDPSSDRFTFQDRDLSFYFRPSPEALYFQVENRQDRPVWIEWDRSTFMDPFGRTGRIANAETRWEQRLGTQASTQIGGLQRYSAYVFPVDYLLDPAGSDQQLHRPLFPEDKSAPQYADREIAVTLVFRLEDRMTPYSFRFRVASVIPR
jgi:hypothetical protein